MCVRESVCMCFCVFLSVVFNKLGVKNKETSEWRKNCCLIVVKRANIIYSRRGGRKQQGVGRAAPLPSKIQIVVGGGIPVRLDGSGRF